MHIMKPSLYERIGGEETVKQAVEIFYKKILEDPMLQPFFAGIDMDRLYKKQVSFMTFAFGGPSDYTYWQKGLRNVHAGSIKKGMTDLHFDRAILHLVASLKEYFTLDKLSEKEMRNTRDLIVEVVNVVESTRHYVLDK